MSKYTFIIKLRMYFSDYIYNMTCQNKPISWLRMWIHTCGALSCNCLHDYILWFVMFECLFLLISYKDFFDFSTALHFALSQHKKHNITKYNLFSFRKIVIFHDIFIDNCRNCHKQKIFKLSQFYQTDFIFYARL